MRPSRCSLVIALAVVLAIAGCGDDLGPPRTRPLPSPDGRPALLGGGAPRSNRVASYRIDAKLDDAAHTVTATMTLTWTNSGASPVDSLPFHLYLNGFKNESSLFMRESGGQHRQAVASTTAWGWIEVESITLGGGGPDLRPGARFAGEDETVLDVPLPAPVAPNATISVDMKFTAKLPEVFARTGYKGHFTMVAQWFPKIGVRVGAPGFERWSCEPFHVNAEFFADFGTYDVVLVVPRTHVVAATGVLVASADNADGTRTLTYRAEDVHDFAWMADPYMDVLVGTAKVDGHDVEVRVYHRPVQRDFAKRHLAAAIGTIEQMSEMFVPYPWSIMSVIDPPMDAVAGAGGMEYPTLVTTAGDSALARPGIHLPEHVTIHEVGHNWFQGILASNEAEEGWLDEGVNEWADGVVMAKLFGPRGSAVDWMGWSAEQFRLRRALSSAADDLPTPIATAAWVFVDTDDYAEASYTRTMLALRTLENVVGRDRFAAAMQTYARTWAFRHPTGRDLFASLAESLDEDIGWFVEPAFYGVGVAELGVRSADCTSTHPPRGVFGTGADRKTIDDSAAPDTGAWTCEVVVQNTGTVPVPVDIEIRFADGTNQRHKWDHRGGTRWHRFKFERSSPITEVEIDPDHNVLLVDDVTNLEQRLEGDGRASWRAAARIGFWGQTLMSVVGL
jgi:hypothetical protein